jgi:molecular chaperone DnaJ
LDLTFEEAAFGVEKDVVVNKFVNCNSCDGTGSKSKSTSTCPACGGSGQVQVKQNTPFGQFVNVKTCDKCHGEGKIISDPCPECGGRGKSRKSVNIKVKIPAGIDQGQTISMRGQGDPGTRGGPAGELLVTVRVKTHSLFRRDGFDVYCDIPITFAEAVLGSEIQVPTLDGRVQYTIPEGTQTGTRFRLKGKGIPHLQRSGRGDQFVNVKVQVPQKLTEHQKQLLREFNESLNGEALKDEKKGFFKKR